MRTIAILLLVTLAFCENEVVVDIFIESECPGCIEFVNNSLKTALATKDFEKIAKVQIFPYGNARQTQNADGTWKFTCQHGPVECYGNVLEVCGQDRIINSFEKLRFIQCIESSITQYSTAGFDQALSTCAPRFLLNVQDIHSCMNSNEGNQLQHVVADATDKLNPPHKYVPWIATFGGHDETHQDAIMNDFVGWACKNYRGTERIEACNSKVTEEIQ